VRNPAPPKSKDLPPRCIGPDDATPMGDMVMFGMVKTTKGFAVCTATVSADGSTRLALSGSQSFREYVAAELKRKTLAQALRA
jgi:hypothetical protein